MIMKMAIIDPCKYTKWDSFVLSHNEGTIFHLSNWAKVIQETYGYEPYYLILKDTTDHYKDCFL